MPLIVSGLVISKRSFSDASSLAFEAALDILRKRELQIKQKISILPHGESLRKNLVFSDPRLLSDWKLNKSNFISFLLLVELKIPKFKEMSNFEWIRNKGPQLTRTQAKLNNLIPGILPDETEAMINMRCSFDDNFVARGNFLNPEQVFFINIDFSVFYLQLFNFQHYQTKLTRLIIVGILYYYLTVIIQNMKIKNYIRWLSGWLLI